MDWSKGQGDDPHGIQKLLSLLRAQQDGSGQTDDATAAASVPSVTTDVSSNTQGDRAKSARTGNGASPDRTASAASMDDLRHASFAQALPHLTQLSKDESFLKELLALKSGQDRFEEMLANEREQLVRSTQGQASRSDQLQQWDRQALARWDGVYGRQQERLQQLGVPCFFATRDPAHVRRQQRVFDVLAGLLD